MKTIYMFLSTILLTALFDTASLSHCPEPWDFEGMEGPNPDKMTCYIVSDNKVTWHAAKLECDSYGGHLVSINSLDKYMEVKEIVGNADFESHAERVIWIGANDVIEEGKFVWKDTSLPVTYDKWCGDAPLVDNTNENCLALTRKSGCHWRYDDRACAEEQRFLCERLPDPE